MTNVIWFSRLRAQTTSRGTRYAYVSAAWGWRSGTGCSLSGTRGRSVGASFAGAGNHARRLRSR